MIALVLTVCLLATPGSCREERPHFDGESLIACVTQGQFFAARWMAEHPAYTITRWRCEANVPRQTPI